MSRLFIFGVMLGLVALLSAPISAQTAPKTTARVEHVLVRGDSAADAAIAVEIQTSGASATPNTEAITGPDRIIVDFPGALPAAELHALKVNHGALKGIRAGLFFSDPPITRIVLDLREPQAYQISTAGNRVLIKLSNAPLSNANLSPPNLHAAKLGSVAPIPASVAGSQTRVAARPARFKNAALTAGARFATAKVSPGVSTAEPSRAADISEAPVSAPPLLIVTYTNGMLRIRADKSTLSEVLFEVQRQTQADIAIPAGAEEEQVVVDLGPASARDVLASLLNGSPYNFVFVGDEGSLERVILTRRDPQ